jgi:uncharacterized protein (TIGR03437 family)
MTRSASLALVALSISIPVLEGQDRTVGLFLNDATRTSPGYTLLAPKHNGRTYLIDNNGQYVHTWDSKYEPGQSAYLLPNGHLMRAGMVLVPGGSTGGGEGGRLEEYDWDGNMVWQFDYATADYSIHHDFKVLPNGNVIVLMIERKTLAQALAAGFNPSLLQDNYLQSDAVIEIEPTRPVGGNIVWEWHVWDHLVQKFDSSKANYGDASAHPELIDPNASPRRWPAFWNHMNSIDYNASLDQIILSVRGSSEVWVIDHSTTRAEAAGHTGGKYGKGGDLLYRWGNPQMYYAGKQADQILYEQHDAVWIEAGRAGSGNILVFNNGVNRPGGNYSSVDEFTPPVDATGKYALSSGSAYEPKQLAWTYVGTGANRYYESDISGAYRLPNGNTLICYGTHGVLVEVTQAKEIVWQYVNPVVPEGPLLQGQTPALDVKSHNQNAVFKVQRYAPDYPGLAGRDLTPKGFIEQYGARYVNGASFQTGSTAAGAILAVLGDSGLADSEAAASTSTLATKLGGTSVEITDSAGVTQLCRLYYVSPRQINLVLPDRCATGKATIAVHRDSGNSISGSVTIDPVAPGLFSMGVSGIGAIVGLRVDGSGNRSDVPVFRYDANQKAYAFVPIDLGAANDQVYLSLYGTGIRGFSSVSNLSATIGNRVVPVVGAAAQAQYPGLDQVNIGPLPRTLIGTGSTNLGLKVDGKTANTVTVNIR